MTSAVPTTTAVRCGGLLPFRPSSSSVPRGRPHPPPNNRNPRVNRRTVPVAGWTAAGVDDKSAVVTKGPADHKDTLAILFGLYACTFEKLSSGISFSPPTTRGLTMATASPRRGLQHRAKSREITAGTRAVLVQTCGRPTELSTAAARPPQAWFRARARPALNSSALLPCRSSALSPPKMSSSLIRTNTGGVHVCPSPPRSCRRRCCQVITAASTLPPSAAAPSPWPASPPGSPLLSDGQTRPIHWTSTSRKKLEPLEAYVPAVLLTIDQFVDLVETVYSPSF
ncbi:hypothetical protein BS78_03G190400 [Paspalum vaginatum]|nr:hypothetical protein BS78_03G190400 [Paspalum vaginatum]